MELTAIEWVKKAEEKAQAYEKSVKKDMQEQHQLLQQELEQLTSDNLNQIRAATDERQKEADQEIAENSQKLHQEEEEQSHLLEKQFEANKEAVLSYLIERVKQNYGS
ncbi:hypothetical protein ACWN8V_09685 [Vagococcus elongatus]|uniref:ATPase n=1 Tax=Vagococcus elongatus TaxID=180344 RepID=A0A430ARB2_9ENTE|nr:hypothetical protein [Vagococcus elongatus]RSU10547.1 hypothetical protein CBF29_09655 [Vagococcus elongatus]